jgi:hypothetical protein
MAGGPGNPLGARALYLGDTNYRIHGTNDPSTIGHRVSSGCIRLTNDDIVDLYRRAKVGGKVVVVSGARDAEGARPHLGFDGRPRVSACRRSSSRDEEVGARAFAADESSHAYRRLAALALRTSQKCTNIDNIDRNKKSDANQRQTKGRFS